MPELHETLLGRRFLEHDIPEIHQQISQLNKTLKSSGLSEGINRIADALEDKNKMLSRLHEYREVTKLSNKIESLKKLGINSFSGYRKLCEGIWLKVEPSWRYFAITGAMSSPIYRPKSIQALARASTSK